MSFDLWAAIRSIPAAAFIVCGAVEIYGACFSTLTPEDRTWEVTQGRGSYISIFGYRKYFKEPEVIASGMMPERKARIFKFCFGLLSFVAGIIFLQHEFHLFATSDPSDFGE